MEVIVQHNSQWFHFRQPVRVLRTDRLDQVVPILSAAESSGLYAAGFVSYEAAAAFDPALKTHARGFLPLICLGLFEAPDSTPELPEYSGTFSLGAAASSLTPEQHRDAIREIHRRIALGETYQVNFTHRLRGDFSGDAKCFFRQLVSGQGLAHAAFVDTGDFAVCSASPELFFDYSEGVLVSRPMKGTARRGRTLEEDKACAEYLQHSEKDRAENIMIVDMIRNDIGRIAIPGTVQTRQLFTVEKYPTVWQMTSTVQGESRASLTEVFRALFPCASITGAPKAKTMEIIRELEPVARGVYTGAVGFADPAGNASFNVAIRTAVIDRSRQSLEYGVGGGIVWDSKPEQEYEETRLKARVLTQPRCRFQLLESMLFTPEEGFFLLDEHVNRLARSAEYFGFSLNVDAVEEALATAVEDCPAEGRHKIRLLVSKNGGIEVQVLPLNGAAVPEVPEKRLSGVPTSRSEKVETSKWDASPGVSTSRLLFSHAASPGQAGDETCAWVALAEKPVDSGDIFLYHKTTCRTVYQDALEACPEADDVILWNERGEVTESCFANVVIRHKGQLLTPPVDCGLLAGTFREFLLKTGRITERIIDRDDLKQAEDVFLVNSVRHWRRVAWLDRHAAEAEASADTSDFTSVPHRGTEV